jgi:hypothetical protein
MTHVLSASSWKLNISFLIATMLFYTLQHCKFNVRCIYSYSWRSTTMQSHVMNDSQLTGLSWCQAPTLLLSDSCRFVNVGCHFLHEDGSVIYNFCWSSPMQPFLNPSRMGLKTIFYCLRFETPQFQRVRSPYLFPRNRVALLKPQALGSVFIASDDLQGYCGGI